MNMRKILAFSAVALSLWACGDGSAVVAGSDVAPAAPSSSSGTAAQVLFFNTSSYAVSVHKDAFSGPVILERLASGTSASVKVPVSDNYGVGSVFYPEYWFNVANGLGVGSEVWTGGIDPNTQLAFNVEAGKSYTKQIPQPGRPEFREAFVKVLNASKESLELMRLSLSLRQEQNGELLVPSGGTGVYRFESSADGIEQNHYSVTSVFSSFPVPVFTTRHGWVYSFVFDGSSVRASGEQKLEF
jgi:hypothetical protein